MENLDISVILEVGETEEEKLVRALSALSLNETCRYEILLVGASGNKARAEALERVASFYPEVRILNQDAQNRSVILNAAAKECKGQYVTILSPGDIALPEILDKAWGILSSQDVDLLIGQVTQEKEKKPGKEEEKLVPILPEDVLPIGPSAGIPVERLRLFYLTRNDSQFTKGKGYLDREIHGRFLERSLLLDVPFLEDLSFGAEILWNFEILNHSRGTLLALWPFLQNPMESTQVYSGPWASFPLELDRLLTLYRREIAKWPARDRVYYYNAALEYFPVLCRRYVFSQKDGHEKERFMTEVQSPFWRRVFKRADERNLKASLRMIGALGKAQMDSALYRLCKLSYGGQEKKE